jgi:hypothetical protein
MGDVEGLVARDVTGDAGSARSVRRRMETSIGLHGLECTPPAWDDGLDNDHLLKGGELAVVDPATLKVLLLAPPPSPSPAPCCARALPPRPLRCCRSTSLILPCLAHWVIFCFRRFRNELVESCVARGKCGAWRSILDAVVGAWCGGVVVPGLQVPSAREVAGAAGPYLSSPTVQQTVEALLTGPYSTRRTLELHLVFKNYVFGVRPRACIYLTHGRSSHGHVPMPPRVRVPRGSAARCALGRPRRGCAVHHNDDCFGMPSRV